MSSEVLGKIGKIVGPIIVTLQTVAVIYLAKTVDFPDPPPQKISNLTGLPVWEAATPAPAFLKERANEITDYFAAFTTGVASVAAIIFASRRIDNKLGNLMSRLSRTTTDTPFTINRISWTKYILSFILTAYITVTFLALAAGIVLGGLGKLWAIIGIFHNIMEVCLLAALLQTGRKQFNFAIALLVVVTYGVLATGITSQLDWYYDSLFFKFQGLILDFMLPLVFFRVAVYAKNNPPPNDPESTPLLAGGSSVGGSFNPPRQLGYLVFASFVHLIGNLFNIIGNDSPRTSLVFPISYLIAFPIYTLYVHNESNIVNVEDSQKVFDVPDTSVYDFILIFLWGATSSGISALIGVRNI